MILQLDIQRIIAQATHTFKRFPLVMLSAILATVFSMILIDLDQSSSKIDANLVINLGKWISVFYLGLSLCFAFALFCEKNQLSPIQSAIMQGGSVIILLGTRFLILDNPNYATSIPQFIFLSVFAHLAVSFASYLNDGEENGFWYFNQFLFFRFCLSVLYSVVLFVGIAGALGAIQVLFGSDITPKIYFKIWVFIATLFNTWFFLAGVPDDYKALDAYTEYPQQLKVFTQFVLIPLITLYLGILYLYEVKLAIDWHLPKGLVSYLVLAFSIGGIFSLLLIHPIREKNGNQWVKIYAKTFYIAILPLIALLFVSIGLRVVQYGITENRYIILMLAFWLLGTSANGLVNKNQYIKSIPISLSVIVLFMGFMPFINAFDVARWEQNRILHQLLTKNNIWNNGTLTPKTTKDYEQITSILEYLNNRGKIKDIEKYLGKNKTELLVFEKDEPENIEKKNEMAKDLQKLNYERLKKLKASFAINTNPNKQDNGKYANVENYENPTNKDFVAVEGFKSMYIGNFYNYIQYDEDDKVKKIEETKITMSGMDTQLDIRFHPLTHELNMIFKQNLKKDIPQTASITFNIMPLVEKIYKKSKENNISQEDFYQDFANESKRLQGRLVVKSLGVVPIKDTKSFGIQSLYFYILLK